MSIMIPAIGLMVFFAHFLSLQFRKPGIPDALILMLVVSLFESATLLERPWTT